MSELAERLLLKVAEENEQLQNRLNLWEQVWTALNELGAELGDANKPLAVAASWASMQSRLSKAVQRGDEAHALVADQMGTISGQLDEILRQKAQLADYEEVLAEHRRLTRELDVLLNGKAGAAIKQASLCDIVSQVSRMKHTGTGGSI